MTVRWGIRVAVLVEGVLLALYGVWRDNGAVAILGGFALGMFYVLHVLATDEHQ